MIYINLPCPIFVAITRFPNRCYFICDLSFLCKWPPTDPTRHQAGRRASRRHPLTPMMSYGHVESERKISWLVFLDAGLHTSYARTTWSSPNVVGECITEQRRGAGRIRWCPNWNNIGWREKNMPVPVRIFVVRLIHNFCLWGRVLKCSFDLTTPSKLPVCKKKIK